MQEFFVVLSGFPNSRQISRLFTAAPFISLFTQISFSAPSDRPDSSARVRTYCHGGDLGF